MNEENQLRYDEIYDASTKDEMVKNIMELEDILDANEKYMQEEEERLHKLEAENMAMKAEIAEWHSPKKGIPPKDLMRDFDFFIKQYDGYTREMILIEAYKCRMALYQLRQEYQYLKGDQG